MEDNIQSLPQDLRTKHPKTWTTENVCPWMTGWGSDFISAAVTQLQNGVDGEQTLGKGNLDTKEGRQSVVDIFTKETGETFDVERIKTCYRNHKNKFQPK